MSGVVEFLLARLDEDAAVADAMHPEQQFGNPWHWRSRARVLADVAAKRRIVERFQRSRISDADGWRQQRWTIRTLATAYSSHKDYLKEWRP